MSAQRFPQLDIAQLEGAQRQLADRILSFSLNGLGGPFSLMLRSPEPASHILSLGDYLRHRSFIDDRLIELAILLHARWYSDQYEWALHQSRALKWLSAAAVENIRRGKLPRDLKADEQTICDFCIQLLRDRKVSDETFGAAKELLDEVGLANLTLILGQYAMLSAIIAVAEVAPPDNGVSPLEPCSDPFREECVPGPG
jgi:4-carboxymuconolactone decarboxylase